MTNHVMKTIEGQFTTRAAADLAIEHLVQQHHIERTDIFVDTSSDENSSGSQVSGGDFSAGEQSRSDAPLSGTIRVSADIKNRDTDLARKAFEEVGGSDISIS